MLGIVPKRSLTCERSVPDEKYTRFYGIFGQKKSVFTGNYHVHKWYGLDVIDIACQKNEINPLDTTAIKSEINDQLLLFKQIKGHSEIKCDGKFCYTNAGDYILLDPSADIIIKPQNQFTHFISVHLPKQKFLGWTNSEIDLANVIKSSDPKGMALSAAFPTQCMKSHQVETEPDFLFDLAHIAFKSENQKGHQLNSAVFDQRLTDIVKLIESNLHNPKMSLSWLAKKTDMSERQLQRFLKSKNTSYSNLLTELRLGLFLEQLRHCEKLSVKPNISRIAYKSGFSDISHFNRIFKKYFECSPTQYAAQFFSESFKDTPSLRRNAHGF